MCTVTKAWEFELTDQWTWASNQETLCHTFSKYTVTTSFTFHSQALQFCYEFIFNNFYILLLPRIKVKLFLSRPFNLLLTVNEADGHHQRCSRQDHGKDNREDPGLGQRFRSLSGTVKIFFIHDRNPAIKMNKIFLKIQISTFSFSTKKSVIFFSIKNIMSSDFYYLIPKLMMLTGRLHYEPLKSG